jgi:hypothetical protein
VPKKVSSKTKKAIRKTPAKKPQKKTLKTRLLWTAFFILVLFLALIVCSGVYLALYTDAPPEESKLDSFTDTFVSDNKPIKLFSQKDDRISVDDISEAFSTYNDPESDDNEGISEQVADTDPPNVNTPTKEWLKTEGGTHSPVTTTQKVGGVRVPASGVAIEELVGEKEEKESAYIVNWAEPETESILIPMRTQLQAVLLDRISNIDFKKQVVAEVVRDHISKDGDVLIKKGSFFSGNFRVYDSKPNRAYVQFSKLIYSNGAQQNISAFAKDSSDNLTGLFAKVDHKAGENILKAIGESASAVMSALTYQQTGGLSKTIIDSTAGKQLEKMETDSVVTVEKGRFFTLVFDQPAKIQGDDDE